MSTIKIQINEEGFTIYEEISEITEEQYKVLEKLVEKHKAKEQEKKGLWRPEKGEEYYWISILCKGVERDENRESDLDKFNFEIGNCFRTASEAQAELGRRKALTRIKDYIAREGIEREGTCSINQVVRWFGFCGENADKLIKACESDLKILFGIK